MTFIESLEELLKGHCQLGNGQGAYYEEVLDSFVTHGKYLNNIPEEYHAVELSEIFNLISEYCTPKWIYDINIKRKKDNTKQSKLVNSDIKVLKKAKEVIIKKILYANTYDGILKEYPDFDFDKAIIRDKELIYNEHKELIDITDSRVDIIESSKRYLHGYDTFLELDLLINDLERKEFNYFEKSTYNYLEKPTKAGFKNILSRIKDQYNLAPSENQKQLIDSI